MRPSATFLQPSFRSSSEPFCRPARISSFTSLGVSARISVSVSLQRGPIPPISAEGMLKQTRHASSSLASCARVVMSIIIIPPYNDGVSFVSLIAVCRIYCQIQPYGNTYSNVVWTSYKYIIYNQKK